MSIILSTPSLVKTSTWTDPGNLYISGKYATCTLSRRTTSGALTIEYEDLNRYKIKEIYIRVHGKSSRSSCTVTLTDENNITLASSLSLSVNSDSVVKSSNLVDKINQDKVTINLTVYNGSYYSSNISIEGVSLEIVGEEIIEDETPGIIDSKNMYLGDMPISELYLGNNSISELYLGNTLIYETSKGVVTDGLRYYLDGRDYIQGSTTWQPIVGNHNEFIEFNAPPAKLGNCVKTPDDVTGFAYFNPFIDKVSTFTLEYYVKDIGKTVLDAAAVINLTRSMEYGISASIYSPNYFYEPYKDSIAITLANQDYFLVEHITKFIPNSSLYTQMTCSNGKLELYVNGNLVSTADNFSIHMPSANGGEVALILGSYMPGQSAEFTYASVRYYDRALSKSELDKNREFDLSIY